MSSLKEKQLQLDIMKAKTARLDIEIRMEKAKQEIERLEEHIKLQDELINKKQKELNGEV